jgi:hypothetical protein
MWIMTKIGFFSCVEKPKGMICIRSRKKADIKAFRKLIKGCSKIVRTPKADYLYRVFMHRDDFEKEFYKLAQLVDYHNFKDEVSKTNTKREMLYHQVWATLLRIEKEDFSDDYRNDDQSQSLYNESTGVGDEALRVNSSGNDQSLRSISEPVSVLDESNGVDAADCDGE